MRGQKPISTLQAYAEPRHIYSGNCWNKIDQRSKRQRLERKIVSAMRRKRLNVRIKPLAKPRISQSGITTITVSKAIMKKGRSWNSRRNSIDFHFSPNSVSHFLTCLLNVSSDMSPLSYILKIASAAPVALAFLVCKASSGVASCFGVHFTSARTTSA